MTIQMNIAEAKAKLSELVARAEAGEEVILSRAGKPVVQLKPAQARKRKVVLGSLAHLGPAPGLEVFLAPDRDLEQAAEATDPFVTGKPNAAE